jgi:hypothetical protein
MVSRGRAPDSTTTILSEMRDSERRRIPLEVALKARTHYPLGDPIPVTITITNLFDPPLLLNGRLLVNHRRLPGEVSFSITDPDGKRCDFQRLVSPMAVTNEEFVLLARGMSIQRTVDLADFFAMRKKGVYKVQAYYHNEMDLIVNGSRAWMGQVVSDVNEVSLQ